MSGYQQTKNYIYYTQRPFTSGQIVRDTGICYETIKKYLQDLQSEGFVKIIGIDKGKKVYIYNKYKAEAQPQKKKGRKRYTLEDVQETYSRQIKEWREMFDDLL